MRSKVRAGESVGSIVAAIAVVVSLLAPTPATAQPRESGARTSTERRPPLRDAIAVAANDVRGIRGAEAALTRARAALVEAGRLRRRGEGEASRRAESLAWACLRLARARASSRRAELRARASQRDADRASQDATVAREALATAQAALDAARQRR